MKLILSRKSGLTDLRAALCGAVDQPSIVSWTSRICTGHSHFDNKYHAFLCSEHEILAEIPSINHAFLHEPIQLIEAMKKAKAFCDRAQESHDVTHNRMIKHKKQQTK
jgi:hypothetical protein